MRLRRAFAVYGGFWGRYKVDAGARTITAHAEGALSPNVMGKDITRTYTLNGDRLLAARGGEARQPDAQDRRHHHFVRAPSLSEETTTLVTMKRLSGEPK